MTALVQSEAPRLPRSSRRAPVPSGSAPSGDETVSSLLSRTVIPRLVAGSVRVRRVGLSLVLPVLVLGLWTFVSHQGLVKPVFLPTPEATLQAGWDLFKDGYLVSDFLASVSIVGRGFVVGTVLGLALGLQAGLSRTFERLVGPTLDAIRQIPPLAWLPLIVLWVGIGDLAKTVVISKVVFFPVFLNTVQGIRGVGREYVEVGRVFGLSRWKLARRVIIPGALPSILVGIRYGAGLSWALVVAAEMLSGQSGLGYLISRAQELLESAQLLFAMLLVGLCGFLIDRGLRLLERRLLRWKQGFQG